MTPTFQGPYGYNSATSQWEAPGRPSLPANPVDVYTDVYSDRY